LALGSIRERLLNVTKGASSKGEPIVRSQTPEPVSVNVSASPLTTSGDTGTLTYLEPPEALQSPLRTFFGYLYILFPNNLLAFVRQQFNVKGPTAEVMRVAVAPLIQSVNLHPALVFYDVDSELQLAHVGSQSLATLPTSIFGLMTTLSLPGHPSATHGHTLTEAEEFATGVTGAVVEGGREQQLAAKEPGLKEPAHETAKALILMRNELLFEKHLRIQYANQYIEEKKRSMEAEVYLRRTASASLRLDQCQANLARMQTLVETQASQHQDKEKRFEQIQVELSTQLNRLKKEKQHLHDQLKKLTTYSSGQAEEIEDLQKQLEDCHTKVLTIPTPVDAAASTTPSSSTSTTGSTSTALSNAGSPPQVGVEQQSDSVNSVPTDPEAETALHPLLYAAEVKVHSLEATLKQRESEYEELVRKKDVEADQLARLLEERDTLARQHSQLVEENRLRTERHAAELQILTSRYSSLKGVNAYLQRHIVEGAHASTGTKSTMFSGLGALPRQPP
jgi:hypothetical protein